MVWAALVALAGTAYAAYAQDKEQDKANEQNLKAQQAAQAYVDKLLGKGDVAFGNASSVASQAFDQAGVALEGLGTAARAQTLRREERAIGTADATLANRGLYNSTRAVGARRAIRSDTDITLASINESVAGIRSTLFRDRARVLSQIQMARAGMYSRYAGLGAQVQLENQYVAAPVGAGIASATQGLTQLLMALGEQGQSTGSGWWSDAQGYASDWQAQNPEVT